MLRHRLCTVLLLSLEAPQSSHCCWKRGGQPAAVRHITTVFRRNESAYSCFRIPGLVRTARGTVIAMAEGRRRADCGDYGGQSDLVGKRSTDSGLTFGPLQKIVDVPKVFGARYAGANGGAVWDPTPVASSMGPVYVWFSFSTSAAASEAGLRSTFYVSSTDDGVRWGAPWNVTQTLNAVHASPRLPASERWSWVQTGGGGHGIETLAGRLIVPGYHGQCAPGGWACSSCPISGSPQCPRFVVGDGQTTFSHAWYSDDAGISWNVSRAFGTATAEGEIVELFSPPSHLGVETATSEQLLGQSLLASGRMDNSPACNPNANGTHNSRCPSSLFMHCGSAAGKPDYNVPHCRRLSRSSDGGLTFGHWFDAAELPDPACKGSLARWEERSAIVSVNDDSTKLGGHGHRVNNHHSQGIPG